jgi:hypothetical protein
MLKILFDKKSALIHLYNGLFFTGMMLVTGSLPTHYGRVYKNLTTLSLGLCYISLGAGSLVATLTMSHVVDWNFRRHARAAHLTVTKDRQQDLTNFPIERVRFQVVVPGHVVGTVGILLFGWTLHVPSSYSRW